MRTTRLLPLGLLGLVVGVGLMAHTCSRAATEALSEEAKFAIEVSCRGQGERAARECRSMLRKLYVAGSLDPDRTLRAYCDSFKNARWGGSRPAPPKICQERYGGWSQG